MSNTPEQWDDNEPLVGEGAIAGRCDFRNNDCINDGVVVDGVWRCRNHLASPRSVAKRTRPKAAGEDTQLAVVCPCGLKDIPIGAMGVRWYWQRHARTGCTLELPNEKCWCGLLRSEHVEGHAAEGKSQGGEDAQVAQRLTEIRKRQDLRRLNHKVFSGSTEALDDIDYLLSLVDTARQQGAEAERERKSV